MSAMTMKVPPSNGVAAPTIEQLLRTIAAVTGVGLALGLLIGGIGSRLAMRALFLTSTSVRGVVSDDGFRIGQFSVTATLNLLLVGTIIGVIGAFVYLAVRPFLLGPRWLQVLTCGVAAGAVVGSMLVHVDGVDFTLLGPRWFAIALFVALPGLFGLVAPGAVEKAIRPEGWFQTAPRTRALLPLVAFAFPPMLLVLGLPLAVVLAARSLLARSPRMVGVMRHPAMLWAVRAVWLAIAIAGAVALTQDSRALLS